MLLSAATLMKGLRYGLATVALVIVGYIVAGLTGGAVPTNRSWTPPARGVRIFVESNGIHVSLVVPKVVAGVDWRGMAPGADLLDPRYAGYDHLAIGWGERAFYLETPTWADVRLRTVLAAARGSDATLMHVEHVPAPRLSDSTRAITLRPDEYRRLAAYIRSSFAAAPDRARFRGYDVNDVFYTARGRYDAVRTCNAWVGEALRRAGVRIGRWTPFPVTVTAWF